MYDIEASFDAETLKEPRNRPTVVLIEPLDPRVIEAACYLPRYARPVFLARESEVRDVVARQLGHVDPNRVEFALSESAFVSIPERSDLVEEFAQFYQEQAAGDGHDVSLDEARKFVSEPGHFGVLAVRKEHADCVVGGATHEPKDFFRPMIKMLRRQDFCSEAGVFVLPDEHPEAIFPHNIVVFGDVGVNATMTPSLLAQVAVGTCAVARDLIPVKVLPVIRGAIVSYSNRGGDEGPSPELVRAAMDLVPGVLEERIAKGERYRSIVIEGEVKMSVALSERSAMYYRGGQSDWSGSPTVIVCPNLDMGNLLYHLYATRFPGAKKFTVMFGLRFRGVDLAMDTTSEDIRLSVKAAVLRMHTFGDWKRTPRDTFFRRYRVLAINPGSTSTRISVFEGDEECFTTELQHSAAELAPFEGQPITAQFAFRKEVIARALAEKGIAVCDVDAFAGRGGVLHPVPHGTITVNDAMCADLRTGRYGDHASSLGGLIAHELVGDSGRPTFIVDPVVVDEAPERVKITGVKELRRRVISHALNQIATARRYAEEHETFYEKVNVVVCHLGGGISIGAHKRGSYIDVNNGLDGEGPFTPQRSGSLPVGQLIDLCFSGKYTKPELKKLNKGRGGLIDLLGTADLREVERRIAEGDREAEAVVDAMAYQIGKWICSLIPAFDGERIDRILLTGGMARSGQFVARITAAVKGLACGISVYPGENEMGALVKGALRVLQGKESAHTYTREA